MSKLNEADFYYGAILSHCFHNKKQVPILLEDGEHRRIYQCTNNQGDFKLFTKYRKMPMEPKNQNNSTWQFVFSEKDMCELQKMIQEDGENSLGLVCGKVPLNQSEIVFLHKEEIERLLKAHKTSITIKRNKNGKKFYIPMKNREDNMQIDTNRSK